MSAEIRHIAIDVRLEGGEISGHAGDGVGEPTPFAGWLGLLGVLDGLLAVATRKDGRPAVHAIAED